MLEVSAYELLVMCALSANTILLYVKLFLAKIPGLAYISGLFIPTLFILLIALSHRELFPAINGKDIGFAILVCILLLISPLYQAENAVYVRQYMPRVLTEMLPFYFLGLTMNVDARLKKCIASISYLSVYVAILYYLYYYGKGGHFSEDEMNISYVVVVSVLVVLYNTFNNVSVHGVITSILGVGYIMFLGTRGPLVIIIFFSAYHLIFRTRWNRNFKVLVIMIAILLVIYIASGGLATILLPLKSIASAFGLSTRVIDSILYNVATNSNQQRQLIYSTLLGKLSERPIIGFGLFGEYPYIHWNAHNMFLQTCFEFGYPIGSILIISFIARSYKAIKHNKNRDAVDYLLLWFIFIFVQAFFGGNIVSYYMFFTIGLVTRQIREKGLRPEEKNNSNTIMQGEH